MYKKSSVLLFLLGISFLFSGCLINKNKISIASKVDSNIEKPNIIFYLTDYQDVYDYGCYGNDKVRTTSVDRLSEEGLLFTNALKRVANAFKNEPF